MKHFEAALPTFIGATMALLTIIFLTVAYAYFTGGTYDKVV